MIRYTMTRALPALLAVALAGCGGGSGGDAQPMPPAQLAQTAMAGYWQPANTSNEGYEFFGAVTAPPFRVELKTGRVLKNGADQGPFIWESNADGSIKISKIDPTCDRRPLSLCPVTGNATLVAEAATDQGSAWKLSIDDNADGKMDRTVSDRFQRANLDLSALPQGEFLMNRADQFDLPTLAYRNGDQIGIRMDSIGQPVALTAAVPRGAVRSVSFEAGERLSAQNSVKFTRTAGGTVDLPVKFWYENVVLSGGINNGFILEYEIHRKIQYPANVTPDSIKVNDFEKSEKRSSYFGRIDGYVHGPTIAANDKFNTFMIVDFDPAWVSGGAGNELEFTSATEGSIAHTDLRNGKYSERRKFTWVQKADGEVVMSFLSGQSVSMRFVKAVSGGYRVVFKLPNAQVGTMYVLHDLVVARPAILAEKDVAGHYTFISSDGVTQNHVTLHKDHTVTGIVGGHWFLDTNGDIVSFECTGLDGKDLPVYQDCFNSFDKLPQMSFAHIRRMRFMYQEGNTFQVKYDAALYGARFEVVNRDYFTISWTYRFTRLGDE
jgi:hypothetical protein